MEHPRTKRNHKLVGCLSTVYYAARSVIGDKLTPKASIKATVMGPDSIAVPTSSFSERLPRSLMVIHRTLSIARM